MRTEEHQHIKATASAFARGEISPYLDEWESQGIVPRELTTKAGAADLLGIGYAEGAGGAGGDITHLFSMIEGIMEAGGSLGVLVPLLTHHLVVPAIVNFGSAELLDRYVRPTLAGTRLCALAVTEPEAGSDVRALRTEAKLDGDAYVVHGSKMFISNAIRADYVLAAVATPTDRGRRISLLIIDCDTPGFKVSRALDKMGWRSSDTAEIVFDGCRVPASNLVGEEGTGFRTLGAGFAYERLMLAAECYAAAERCLQLSVRYAQQRKTFGQSIFSHQVIRHKLAEMARQVDVSRAYVWAVAERQAQGEDVTVQAAMAKNTAVKALDHVVDDAVQIHGGLGYIRESEVERHYRDSRVMGIGGGTTEIMNEIIGRGLAEGS